MPYSKYNNRKARIGGVVFDSRAEASRWRELCLMERAGEIHNLRRQVSYELIPSQYEGKRCVERSCRYVADFVYTTRDGVEVVEDVKGTRTPEYIIKRKLMLYVHHIKIREVTTRR